MNYRSSCRPQAFCETPTTHVLTKLLTAVCKRDTLYTHVPNHAILAQYSSIDTSATRRLCQTNIIKSMGQSAGAVRPANLIATTHRQQLNHCSRMSYRRAQCGSVPARSCASAAGAAAVL